MNTATTAVEINKPTMTPAGLKKASPFSSPLNAARLIRGPEPIDRARLAYLRARLEPALSDHESIQRAMTEAVKALAVALETSSAAASSPPFSAGSDTTAPVESTCVPSAESIPAEVNQEQNSEALSYRDLIAAIQSRLANRPLTPREHAVFATDGALLPEALTLAREDAARGGSKEAASVLAVAAIYQAYIDFGQRQAFVAEQPKPRSLVNFKSHLALWHSRAGELHPILSSHEPQRTTATMGSEKTPASGEITADDLLDEAAVDSLVDQELDRDPSNDTGWSREALPYKEVAAAINRRMANKTLSGLELSAFLPDGSLSPLLLRQARRDAATRNTLSTDAKLLLKKAESFDSFRDALRRIQAPAERGEEVLLKHLASLRIRYEDTSGARARTALASEAEATTKTFVGDSMLEAAALNVALRRSARGYVEGKENISAVSRKLDLLNRALTNARAAQKHLEPSI